MVKATRDKTAMLLLVDVGILDGKQRLATRRYTLKNENSTDEQIYQAGLAIASLMSRDLMQIKSEKLDVLVDA